MFEVPVIETIGHSTTVKVVPVEADGVTPTPDAVVESAEWSHTGKSVVEETLYADCTASYKGLKKGSTTISVKAVVKDAGGKSATFEQSAVLTVDKKATETEEAPMHKSKPGHTAGIQIEFTTPA